MTFGINELIPRQRDAMFTLLRLEAARKLSPAMAAQRARKFDILNPATSGWPQFLSRPIGELVALPLHARAGLIAASYTRLLELHQLARADISDLCMFLIQK